MVRLRSGYNALVSKTRVRESGPQCSNPVLTASLSYTRIPNHNCPVCNTAVYKRPIQIEKGRVYCSRKCSQAKNRKPPVPCMNCGKDFVPTIRARNKFCSHKCSNEARAGSKYVGGVMNASATRLKELRDTFEFKTCMVRGCTYDKTFDVHRLIEGQDGGEYVVGNMFAICPNHHAETHRKICKLVKVDDKTLLAEYGRY